MLALLLLWSALGAPLVFSPDQTCSGDPACDASPALAAMIAEVAEVPYATLDLRGAWYLTEPLTIACTRCRILAGDFHVMPGHTLPVIVRIDVRGRVDMQGVLRASGRRTGWHKNRTAVDGVHLVSAGGLRADGFEVRDVARWCLRNTGHVIGANLGAVSTTWCGTPGGVGSPSYTRVETVATSIERTGGAGSFKQRAHVHLADVHPQLQVGDRAWVGLHLVQVREITEDGIVVFPWPGALEGVGEWPVDPVIGGGVQIVGGNTTGLTIGSFTAGYVGVGMEVKSLYGVHVTAPVVEVGGVGIVIGAYNATTWGVSIRGYHPEILGADLVQAGYNVQRCQIVSPVVDLVLGGRYRVASAVRRDGTTREGEGAFRSRCAVIPPPE